MSERSLHFDGIAGKRYTSDAKENTALLRTEAGRLMNLKASNLSGTDLFLQIHDRKTALAGGGTEVPIFSVPLRALGYYDVEGFSCATGVVVAVSTTDFTYTAPGAASACFYAETR
jgi:hypothetical protein